MRHKLQFSANFLRDTAASMEVTMSHTQAKILIAYTETLYTWNKSRNLIAPASRTTILQKHILDCCAVVPHLPSGCVLDVGCGAGLPAVVIAVLRPDCRVIAVDARKKKTTF